MDERSESKAELGKILEGFQEVSETLERLSEEKDPEVVDRLPNVIPGGL